MLSPLGIVHLSDRVQPGFGRVGELIKFDTVDESSGCARDALGCSILPDVARVHLGVILVVLPVIKAQNGVVVKSKLIGDLLGPVLDEVVFGHGSQG